MTPFAADLRRALRYRNQTRPDLVRATGACDEEGRGAARDGTGCVGGGCRRADVPGDEGGSRMTDCKHAVVTMTPVCEDCDSVYVDKDRWVALPTIDPTTPLTAESARAARGAAGMTLRTAASLLHIDFTYLSKVENGHERPSDALLLRMGKVYEYDGPAAVLARKVAEVPPDVRAAIELAAARRAIEGSGVVSVEAVAPAINGILSIGWLVDSLTEPVGWEGKPNPHQWLYDAIVAAGKAVDSALPRPEEPRVERCCDQPEDGINHRCWSGYKRRQRRAGDGLHVIPTCHPFTPEAR